MKKNVVLIWLLLLAFSSLGQKYKPSGIMHYSRVDNKLIHFGFSLSAGFFDYSIVNSNYAGDASYRAEQVQFQNSFRLGVISELNMTKSFSLRALPGLYFGSRTLDFVNVPEGLPSTTTLNSVYGDFPLLLKYKGKRIGNYTLFVVSGISYRFDLVPHDKLEPNDILIRTNVSDFAFEIGGGVDIYTPYFKMGLELKLSVGLKDILNHTLDDEFPEYENYTLAIEEMTSNIVSITLHLE